MPCHGLLKSCLFPLCTLVLMPTPPAANATFPARDGDLNSAQTLDVLWCFCFPCGSIGFSLSIYDKPITESKALSGSPPSTPDQPYKAGSSPSCRTEEGQEEAELRCPAPSSVSSPPPSPPPSTGLTLQASLIGSFSVITHLFPILGNKSLNRE